VRPRLWLAVLEAERDAIVGRAGGSAGDAVHGEDGRMKDAGTSLYHTFASTVGPRARKRQTVAQGNRNGEEANGRRVRLLFSKAVERTGRALRRRVGRSPRHDAARTGLETARTSSGKARRSRDGRRKTCAMEQLRRASGSKASEGERRDDRATQGAAELGCR
jgi:hypothetical protein